MSPERFVKGWSERTVDAVGVTGFHSPNPTLKRPILGAIGRGLSCLSSFWTRARNSVFSLFEFPNWPGDLGKGCVA